MAALRAPKSQKRQWLTTPRMAALIDFHVKTLLKYANANRVPAPYLLKVGNRFRWRADFVDHPVFLDVPRA